MRRPLSAQRRVRFRNPVVRLHPLAPRYWWLAPHGLEGSSQWSDISGRAAHATITYGTSAANAAWIASHRPGLAGIDFRPPLPLGNPGAVATVGTAPTTLLPSVTAATVSMWLRLRNATPSFADFSGVMRAGNTGSFSHYPYTNSNAYLGAFVVNRKDNIPLSSAVDRTDWHLLTIAAQASGNWDLYQNDIPVYTTSAESSISLPTNFVWGGDSSTYFCDGTIVSVMLDDRYRSAADVAEWYRQARNGWPDLLRRMRPSRSVVALGSPTAYTLTANSGSFSLAGTAASLTSSRLLSASAGNFTETGADAGLLVGRLLSASPGAFALAGQDASLLAGRLLGASAGAFSLTGQDAGLLAGRLLTASTGSFSLTGSDVGLFAGRTLVAAPGSFALAGTDAGLLASRVLIASPGSFALTGQDAGLIYGAVGAYTLSANPGSFTLTGQDAGLVAARSLTAATGAFALTGSDAGLLASRVLVASQGSLVLAGNAAGLLAGRVLGAGTGSFALTGQDAGLFATTAGSFVLSANPGSFTLTGQDAGLVAGRVLGAGVGSLTLTGNPTSLLAARLLGCSVGTFALTGNAVGLIATRFLVATAGSFALTGSLAGLIAGRVVVASPGAFAFAGNAAGLIVSRSISASPGAFTLTGSDASLTRTYRLTAAAGAFTLIGMPATLVLVVGSTVTVGLGISRRRLLLLLAAARRRREAGEEPGGGGDEEVVAGDLREAFVLAFDDSDSLESLFGQVLIVGADGRTYGVKRFRGVAGRHAVPPYLVVDGLDGPDAAFESGGGFTAAGEIQATVYAETDTQAKALASAVVEYYRTVPLQWQGGSAAGVFLINPFQGVFRDPETWKNGKQIWSKTLRFRVLMGG